MTNFKDHDDTWIPNNCSLLSCVRADPLSSVVCGNFAVKELLLCCVTDLHHRICIPTEVSWAATYRNLLGRYGPQFKKSAKDRVNCGILLRRSISNRGHNWASRAWRVVNRTSARGHKAPPRVVLNGLGVFGRTDINWLPLGTFRECVQLVIRQMESAKLVTGRTFTEVKSFAFHLVLCCCNHMKHFA